MIVDPIGRIHAMIESGGRTEIEIDLRPMARGVYTVVATRGDESWSEKLSVSPRIRRPGALRLWKARYYGPATCSGSATPPKDIKNPPRSDGEWLSIPPSISYAAFEHGSA